eukprot:CAMPEP_0181172482 /NCGR_PEP_ID=MMETSP1096-20121128/2471_1 /TAXON_ID=156174 ORGANISM="Chrysochromulina ericina, Strain CCMP281" /NCGR_SAMPLE_ID=MMETSP1096 /ASSEMBLY_ACC=CAM_ASM_000453 /LENGTH=157 /DNA_ID=CAMNT_0023260209 /DNA_START=28 /DNA_END=501 /DNA_ORIENTATION=-
MVVRASARSLTITDQTAGFFPGGSRKHTQNSSHISSENQHLPPPPPLVIDCPSTCLAQKLAVIHRLRGSPFCPAACRAGAKQPQYCSPRVRSCGAHHVCVAGDPQIESDEARWPRASAVAMVLQPSDLQHPLLRMQTVVQDSARMLAHASGRKHLDR